MIAAVLDTNTIVSGTLEPRGIPNRILQAARSGNFTLVTSSVIIEEVVRTLRRPRITRKYDIQETDVRHVHDLLTYGAALTVITATLHGVASHPEDDLILATALSAKADYLVTGDLPLQKLRTFLDVTIVSPREFLGRLAEKER